MINQIKDCKKCILIPHKRHASISHYMTHNQRLDVYCIYTSFLENWYNLCVLLRVIQVFHVYNYYISVAIIIFVATDHQLAKYSCIILTIFLQMKETSLSLRKHYLRVNFLICSIIHQESRIGCIYTSARRSVI